MSDFVNWSQAMLTPAQLKTKNEQRAEIAKHTEEFLANGGEITVLPYDPTAEIMARVGYWGNGLGSIEDMGQRYSFGGADDTSSNSGQSLSDFEEDDDIDVYQ